MGADFESTQWSLVLKAQDGSQTEAGAALEALCQIYWQPLYDYVRHQGVTREEALDLTQGYFAELLEKRFLTDVDSAKGRFRSFLLVSLRHYLSHQRDRIRSLKRGGGIVKLSLDVERGQAGYAPRPVAALTPEDIFERRWAATVLVRAMVRLRAEAVSACNVEKFERLKQYLTSDDSQAPYEETAEDLGISTGAVATAVHRLRERYGKCLRAEIATTVVDREEIDNELRHLLDLIRS